MPWVAFYVGIGVLGLAVLAGVGIFLYKQVRGAISDLKLAGERMTAASDQLSGQTAARVPRA